jgi:asparagine synthase (glutamine-hydrolysing)
LTKAFLEEGQMCFVVSLKEVADAERIGDIWIKGNYHRHPKGFLVFKGECTDYENEEFYTRVAQEGVGVVPQTKGEFALVCYDSESQRIYIANDRLGRETLFYFHREGAFIVSDDFWEIIKLVEPDESDVDTQAVKEQAVFTYALFHKTVIRDLNCFPPASIGDFSLQDHTFEIKQYWDFRYKPNEDLTINQAVGRLGHLLDDSIRRIGDRNGKSAVYGIGLSGGLDSRLIPHYALKHGLALRSFIIGQRRPHKFLLSRDHASARKLAKYYGLSHREVDYDSESFEAKCFRDVRCYPMGPSQFFITVYDNIPKFEILLTGMDGGELLGQVLPSNIMRLTEGELLDAIIGTYSYMRSTARRRSQNIISRALRIVSRAASGSAPGEEVMIRKRIDGIMDEKAFETAKSKVRQFIKDNSGKSNIDIWQKYLFFHRANRNKYGAFASLHGRRRSYSIFLDPYLWEETLTWKPEFFINRRLQSYFFVQKFPDLAKIKAQDWQPALFYRHRRPAALRRVLALMIFALRGNGVLRYSDWALGRRYQDWSRKVLLKDNRIFSSIFDVGKIMQLGKEYGRLYENLVKIKQVLDLIETKGYRDFMWSPGGGSEQ